MAEERLISREPKFAKALRERPTIIPRGIVRERALSFIKDVGESMRDPEVQSDIVASYITYLTMQGATEIIKKGIGPIIRRRVSERLR